MQWKPPLPEEITEHHLLDAFPILSPGECRVLRWLCQGKTDEEIASIIDLAVTTVSTHVRNMLGKLGLENRVVLVVEVFRAVICGAPRTRG